MAFKEISERVSPSPAAAEASFRLKRRGKSSRPSLMIAVKKSLLERISWEACGINLLIGEGEDEGKLRLKRVPKGTGLGQFIIRKGSGVVDFGFVAHFGERETEKISVAAHVVEADVLQITIPKGLEDHTYEDDDRPQRRERVREAIEPVSAQTKPPNPPAGSGRVQEKAPALAPPLPSTKGASPAVGKNGVCVTFDPRPKISYDGEDLELTPRQAKFLSVLVTGLGNVMLTGDILHKTGIATAAQVSDDFLVLGKVLPDIGLNIRFVPKMGYALSIA